ncbi:MAG TPA: TlpA disulfide reductase family protein [Candidatus Polarisedimenticolia bacterium]|nr:TlpA disulfide reductase family protein [Candidatus Polarisedimenticolia bacterium]
MKRIAAALAAVLLVGAAAASPPRTGDSVSSAGPVTVHDLDGRPVDLQARFGPAAGVRVTLMVFWASWCLPCLHEVPVLKELQRFYGPDRFQVLGVGVNSGDETRENISRAVQRHGMTYPVLFDGEGQAASAFGIRSLPSSALIGSDGKILWSGPALPRDISGRIKAALGPGEERDAE